MDYSDLYDITPEEEAAQDIREAEREVDEWLASWADDFHSDEWLSALIIQEEPATVREKMAEEAA